jgi:2-hydroxy-3-keto-5-methylthiopentenyl-1-phosphate phosphatase
MNTNHPKYLVQCDFDGTITYKDVSYLVLDRFAGDGWRELLLQYQRGELSVGAFNTLAFGMVKASKKTVLDYVLNSPDVTIRPGFKELVDYCRGRGFEFVVVSNGTDFYIKALLEKLGLGDVRYYAAKSRFLRGGLDVKYITPDGKITEDKFKDKHTEMFLAQGYKVIYIGNGISDYSAAKLAGGHVFATEDLLRSCNELGLACSAFEDLHEVVRVLRTLELD